MSRLQPSPWSGPVLLFDGDCGLCNRVVRLLLHLDREGKLRFAPLQGALAQAYLRSHRLPERDFDSLVFVPDWAHRDRPEYRRRTDGVVAALRQLRPFGTLLALPLQALPRAWCDALYRWVAAVR